MKNCQATFCTPFKICLKWARFIRNVKLCKFIENTLKIDYTRNVLDMDCQTQGRFMIELYISEICHKFQ
jgi:hypothetical protein